jgi:hypothetical protein
MKIFNPTMQICFRGRIGKVTPLNPILIPPVQSLGDLLLERTLLMLYSSIAHSYSLTKSSFLHCPILYASGLHHHISINTPVNFNLEQECRYPMLPGLLLKNIIDITCFRWNQLKVYTFKS